MTNVDQSTSKHKSNGANGAASAAATLDPIDLAQPSFDLEKDTIWDACKWVMLEAEKFHNIPIATARNAVSATRSLFSILVAGSDPEPTLKWVTEGNNLDNIANRWAISKRQAAGRGSDDTAKTYKGRVEQLVEEYTERCKQGINYDPHKRRFGKAKATTTPKADRKAAKKTEQVEATPPPVASSNQLVIPLSATETAHLQLPFEPEKLDFTHISKVVGILSGHVPFKMEDVKRLVGKLAPQAEDFDPIEPLTVQLFNKK